MNTGGTDDILTHERSALLSTEPEALANDVRRLVEDRSLRERLGGGAKRDVSERFGPVAVLDRIEAPLSVGHDVVNENRLRVAVLARSVYPFHPYGGLERHVFDLVRHLLARDVKVTLITRPATAPKADDRRVNGSDLQHPGLSMIASRTGRSPSRAVAGRRLLIETLRTCGSAGVQAGSRRDWRKRDGWTLCTGLEPAVWATRRRMETIVARHMFSIRRGSRNSARNRTSWGRVKGWAYWPLQIAVRRCAAAADRVIATDGVLVGPVRQHLDLPEGKVRLIPNAVAIETCDSTGSAERATELRTSVGLNSGDSLLLSVGRLEANKGFDVLARALGEIAARSTEPDAIRAHWKWVLVGTGPLRRKLERLVARLGLEARVVFTGSVSDSTLHSWYRAATLFVHPTSTRAAPSSPWKRWFIVVLLSPPGPVGCQTRCTPV